MSEPPQEWMPREEWDALVRGEGCPLCAAIASDEASDPHGYTVADLSMGRLRLAANQSLPGYCILLCHRHVREPYELASRERVRFFEDMMQAGQALERVYGADKLNFEILGNAVPHLHAHILPRHHGDPAPHQPYRHYEHPARRLEPEEYEAQAEKIREALEGA
jgi:diadenosine tetraphosphate (Ap4A) HIT family hydrolase